VSPAAKTGPRTLDTAYRVTLDTVYGVTPNTESVVTPNTEYVVTLDTEYVVTLDTEYGVKGNERAGRRAGLARSATTPTSRQGRASWHHAPP
jgi:hypothetical protein